MTFFLNGGPHITKLTNFLGSLALSCAWSGLPSDSYIILRMYRFALKGFRMILVTRNITSNVMGISFAREWLSVRQKVDK